MFDFHEKRKIRSWMYSKVTIGILFVLAVVLGMSVIQRFKVEREMAEKRHEQEAELAEIKQRAAAIEAKVQHLENHRGVEEELRSRFDVAKEGEKVIVIVGEEGEGEDLEALKTPPGTAKEQSWWDFLTFWD